MPGFNMVKIRSAINLAICAVFLILLCLPIVFQVSGIRFNFSTIENRKKTEFPVLITTNGIPLRNAALFIDQFNSYYSDNFAIREIMIQLYTNFKINLLHTNPFPEKVVFGNEGWIFLGDSWSDAITETKGIKNFSDQELDEITKNVTESQKYFDLKRITFFLAIAPEKSTVYGEKLPIQQSARQTKLEQVKKRLSAIGCKLIDLKDDLNKNQNFPLYYKTDSHWNEIGAYYGYVSLMNTIVTSFPMLEILKLQDFSIDTNNHYSGDLANMLSLKIMECRFVLTPVFKRESNRLPGKLKIPESYTRNPKLYERRFGNKIGNLKVLVFHDSFFMTLYKFIPESFRETVLIWSVWEKDIIEQEKPDIVVYELVERDIDALLYPLN